MPNPFRLFIFILVALLFAGPGLAQSKEVTKKSTKVVDREIKQKTLKAKKELKKKRLGVDQSDFMPSANSFGFITSYGLRYNELEQVDRKTINHGISLAGTYSFDKHWSAYVSGALTYQTFNDKVFRENDSDSFYSMSNTDIGVVYSKMRPLSFVRRSSNTLNVSLPTSEQAQVDNHIMNISGTNFIQSYSWKKISLFNRLFADYLWNQLKFSRTTDLVNRDWLLLNSTGITYFYSSKFGVRASFRMNYVRYLNGPWNMSFGNGVAIFSNISGFQLFAAMVNNSYPENDRLSVNYYDEYRRVISAGVTYAF